MSNILSSFPPLPYLLHGDDFSCHLLELPQLSQEVPEPRLGHDPLRSEDFHLIQRRVLLLLGRQLPPDNLILLQLFISQNTMKYFN
jgi:hypothetical protein